MSSPEIMQRMDQLSLPLLLATSITSLSDVELRIIVGHADRAALTYVQGHSHLQGHPRAAHRGSSAACSINTTTATTTAILSIYLII